MPMFVEKYNLIHSFFPINYIGIIPQTSDFELTTEIPRLTYDSGEIIHISATLKNKTLQSYVVSHSFKIISVSYVKSGTDKENTVVPAISKSSYIGPGQSFSTGEKLRISESGQYTIYVDAVIWIADAPYEYTKSFDVLIEQER